MATTAKNSKKKPAPKDKPQETPKEKKPEEKKPEEKKPEKKPEEKKPEETPEGQEKSEKKKKKKKKKKAKTAVGAAGEPKKEEPKKEKKEEPKKGKKEEPKKEEPKAKEKVAEPKENGTKKAEPEGTEKKKKTIIPNVVPKMDPKEQAKLQAMFGNMQKQNARFFLNETGKEYTLDKEDTEDTLDDGSVDLKKIPSVYIKNCKDGKYSFNGRVTKLLIESCDNVTVEINANILTNTMEIWKCKNLSIQVNNEVRTLQLDMMSDSKIRFKKAEDMGQIIWNQLENCPLTFGDESKHNLGFKEMKEKYPDSNFETDQFIVRIIEGEVLEERCVRLKNGYLSTEREAVEWDKRNIIKRDEYVQKFLKEAGITLKKAGPSTEPGPNEKCSCGSGKKYKKCCQGKHKVTGVVGSDLSFKV